MDVDRDRCPWPSDMPSVYVVYDYDIEWRVIDLPHRAWPIRTGKSIGSRSEFVLGELAAVPPFRNFAL
jgi:hypothetical protein